MSAVARPATPVVVIVRRLRHAAAPIGQSVALTYAGKTAAESARFDRVPTLSAAIYRLTSPCTPLRAASIETNDCEALNQQYWQGARRAARGARSVERAHPPQRALSWRAPMC